MSNHKPSTVHDEAHTSGPVKTPKQLLLTVFFAFVVSIFTIIALVYYVATGKKPEAGADLEQAVAARIQKVGTVTLREANRQAKTGEEVYKTQCTNCHAAGLIGAPIFGDAAAWAPRIKAGYTALLTSAVKGKNAMPPQGGGDLSELEIGRAVVYMANAAGAKFEEPKPPAAPAEAAK